MFAHIAPSIRRLALALAMTAVAVPAFAADLSEPAVMQALPLQLQPNVTVIDGYVRLSDLFIGEMAQPDRIVAEAPAPNQRTVLPAEWLASVAQANGLAWRPSSTFERATVFRPGQSIESTEILETVKSALYAQGLPQHYNIRVTTVLNSIVIGANVPKQITVRDARFNPTSGQFAASVEIATGGTQPKIVSINGSAFAMTAVPVLKQAVARNTVLTAEMFNVNELAPNQIPPGSATTLDELIGKSARMPLRAGQTVRETDVRAVSFVTVPVLKSATRRGTRITEDMIDWKEIDAHELVSDAILDETQIIGRVATRMLSFAAPLRLPDVAEITEIEVPVASRDVGRGTTLTEEDVKWVSVDVKTVGPDAVRTVDQLIGFVSNSAVRAGQTFRAISTVRPIAVQKGKLVNLVYHNSAMKLTAKAKALEDGAKGQVMRVVNTKSNSPVLAEVIDADTVRIVTQQAAAN